MAASPQPAAEARHRAPDTRTARRRPGSPANLMVLLAVAALLFATAGPVRAQDEAQRYDIPAGSLNEVLNRFAREAGISISGAGELTAGQESPGLEGRYTVEEGLRRILEGTGLLHRFTDAETVTLAQAGDDADTLSPIQVEGAAVSAFASPEGYAPTRASTATRTDTPIRETPASIQIVPRDVIRDQGAQGLEDIYTNVSGVVESGNTLNAQSEIRPVIRGFESDILLRNGMRSTNVGAVDLVNIESVEVLKGPSSILFGEIEPGGILNYTTKKPQAQPATAVSQTFGSYDYSRTTLDSTGPITADGKWLYRVNAAYTDSESFRDSVERENVTAAPSFLYRPSDRTELLLDFSFSREESTFDSGIPFGADDEPLVDEDTFFGDPDLDGQTLEDTFASYQLRREFNDVVTLRNQLQFHRVEVENEAIRNRGVSGSPGSEVLDRRFQNLDSSEDEIQMVTDLQADFRTGGVQHEVLAGIDLVVQDQESNRFRQSLTPIPISNDPATGIDPPDNQPKDKRQLDNEWVAVYVQDQLTLLDDRLHLLVGGRYDDFSSELEDNGTEQPKVEESEFTGRVGALFDLTEWASPFVSYSQSFNPQGSFAVDANDNLLPPEEGEQFEAGFKFSLPQDRLIATLAVFRIEKENVSVFDLPTFLSTGQVAFTASDQRSEGVELDVSGQLTDELQLIANYAHTDTEVVDNPADPSQEGDRRGNVPENTVRLWLAYEFGADSRWSGLGIGGGVRYESERKAQFDDTELDSFTTLDTGVWYTQPLVGGKLLRAQLNIENLTDEEYFPRASDQSIVHPGEPRSVTASLTLEF